MPRPPTRRPPGPPGRPPTQPASPPGPWRRRPPSWSVVGVALALAVLGFAVALAALLLAPDGEPADRTGEEALRNSALNAARERTTDLTTYDFTTLDADFARVLETATGAFEQEYRATSEQLRTTFTRSKAVASGSVLAAGIEELAPQRAVAVVAVDQVIRTAGQAPRRERNRLRMVLVRPQDTWLVERVQRL